MLLVENRHIKINNKKNKNKYKYKFEQTIQKIINVCINIKW